ncbi:MAG: hypothetical protein ACI87W_003544, partial [Halieaceae bacterium]
EQSLAVSFIGSADTITSGLSTFLDALQPDELIVTAHIFDQAARLRSIEIISQVHDSLGDARNHAPTSAMEVAS